MFRQILGFFMLGCALCSLAATPVHAQQHRATRLGNPATRFADPLQTPADLRAMLRSPALRSDVEFIARESGYAGTMDDLLRAAATNNILPLRIPVGTRMQAMSTRKNGKAVLLRDVLWAGQEAIDAYELYFTSAGRRYRVVSPKACANFWVEDYGKELRPALALECMAPNEVALRRPVQVCLTVTNSGDDFDNLARAALPIPAGTTFAGATGGGKEVAGNVVWEWPRFAPGAVQSVCANFNVLQPGSLDFLPTARGQVAAPVQTRCATRVFGIPAVLIELVDLTDPIEVGSDETYDVFVLNQGTAPLSNVKLVCTLEEGQQFTSGTGITEVRGVDRTITMENLPVLNPKEKATWRVLVKTLTAGDVRFTAEFTSDEFQKPVKETESTQQY